MSSSPTAVLSRRQLMEVFAHVPDPRDPRGVRHGLATLLTLAQTAVLAGARTLLAIAEWTQDADRDMLSRIGIAADQPLPSESTMRRTLALLDANDLDARLAGWMATRVGHLAGRRVIAVDGKTMRGARTTAGAPHLVAAFDQSAGAVLGQLAVASKSNEIPALRDLLDRMDITDAVVSADAMHCQRETASHITGRGGHYVLTVKANQPTLRAACKALHWRDVPEVSTTDPSHGRRVRRTIKAVQAPDWIDFPGAAQIIQLRRTRTIKGRKTIEVVYAICSLDMIAAPPATVATWIRDHWAVENALHWVRDVVFDEDRHQLRTGNGPQVMATLRNTAISLLRLAGHTKIATALRHHGRSTSRPSNSCSPHERLCRRPGTSWGSLWTS
jgi:predicted transposase YbfD/YdcC